MRALDVYRGKLSTVNSSLEKNNFTHTLTQLPSPGTLECSLEGIGKKHLLSEFLTFNNKHVEVQ